MSYFNPHHELPSLEESKKFVCLPLDPDQLDTFLNSIEIAEKSLYSLPAEIELKDSINFNGAFNL